VKCGLECSGYVSRREKNKLTFNYKTVEASSSQAAVFNTPVVVGRIVERNIDYHQSVRVIPVQLSESSVTPVIMHSLITQVDVFLTDHWWTDYTSPVDVFGQLRGTRKLYRLSDLHHAVIVLVRDI